MRLACSGLQRPRWVVREPSHSLRENPDLKKISIERIFGYWTGMQIVQFTAGTWILRNEHMDSEGITDPMTSLK
jgi:hypothetical protein